MTHDTTKYLDRSKGKRLRLTKSRLSTATISRERLTNELLLSRFGRSSMTSRSISIHFHERVMARSRGNRCEE